MSPSCSTCYQTHSKNADTHPGDAVSRQKKCTKAQIEAAKEAENLERKQKEVERRTKFAKVAQTEDEIVKEMPSQESLEPHLRPPQRPLKRTYGLFNVVTGSLEPPERKQPSVPSDSGDASESYVLSDSVHYSESILDPASDSDNEPKTQEKERKVKGKLGP